MSFPLYNPLPSASERTLLRDILRHVSRSFYLSLIVLPKAVRQQVSMAYLFCRAADPMADTDMLAPGLFPCIWAFGSRRSSADRGVGVDAHPGDGDGSPIIPG